MGKKLQKYLDEAEKTEQQIAELEERLRTIRAAQKKEEDSEIIRAIRSTRMGGRELLALLDNIQAGNVTFLTAANNASEEAETEEAIEKDFIGYQGSAVLDEPVREEDSFSKESMSQESEISENILLPDLAKQSESIEQQSGEIAERGMPT